MPTRVWLISCRMQKVIFKSATMCLTESMLRLRFFLLLLPVLLLQTGCSSTQNQTATTPSNLDANGEAISSVPWNKPESWESQGQLGAMTH